MTERPAVARAGGADPAGPLAPDDADPRAVPFRVVGAEAGVEGVLVCPLCGSRFAHGGLVCSACPLHAGCDLIRCPSCGYQFPRRSRVVDAVRRLLARARGRTP